MFLAKETQVAASPAKADLFDWSTPVPAASAKTEPSLDFDWSQPVAAKKDDNFEIQWSDDDDVAGGSDSDSSDGGITMKNSMKEEGEGDEDEGQVASVRNGSIDAEGEQQETGHLDIMAQQLKFIACLKILMGEMATLTTGFEVDGGQLRLQLYLWLDRELQALQQLCNYSPTPVSNVAGDGGDDDEEPSLLPPMPASFKDAYNAAEESVTLHEILMTEKLNLEAKVKRTARRRRWLKGNELLLRTLLSYCGVHGSQGGGLASVRMELILLLQELQQDRRSSGASVNRDVTNQTNQQQPQQQQQQQLLSPVPLPTNLPLLAASVAGAKIIMTDPVRHLEVTDLVSPRHIRRSKLTNPSNITRTESNS